MALSPDPFSASSNLLLLCAEDADDVASWEPPDPAPSPSPSPSSPGGGGGGGDDDDDGDVWWAPPPPAAPDDRHMPVMLAAEPDHMPRPDYLSRFHDRSLDVTSRQDAVNWILKVNEFYRFRPVTAYLAVNYLDRFLSSRTLPLVSVASVWVAAKMEETHVPTLLDLQMAEGPRHVFEARTVRRMELLLMSSLGWRMRSPTPFDFLPHLAPPSAARAAAAALLARAASLVLNTHRVVDFLGYRASEIAAAAMLCAAGEIGDSSAGCHGEELASCLEKWVSKDVVCGCRQLMEEYLIDTCPSADRRLKPVPEPTRPPSPVGVLDAAAAAACGSCDTQKSSSFAAAVRPPPPPPLPPELAHADDPPSPPPPPPSKRRRLAESHCTARIDTGQD